jgi:hypothetical protein
LVAIAAILVLAKRPATLSTMPNFNSEWLAALEERFGRKVSEIRKIGAKDKPVIHALVFHDTPKRYLTTAVTCGLSDTTHPHWSEKKPELVITMNSPKLHWGLGAAWVASLFFDEMRFHYGDLFKIGSPISDEGPMDAVFLFAPSFVEAHAPFTLSDRTIHLVGTYPIHEAEIEVYRAIGLESFFKHPAFDSYDPERKPIDQGG